MFFPNAKEGYCLYSISTPMALTLLW